MRLNKNKCDLQSCNFCKGCSKEWLIAVDEHRKVYKVAKGESLFTEGDAVTGMFFINSGLVKVHKRWDHEKEMILRFANQGAIVGHRGLGGDAIYPVSGTALVNTEVCYVQMDFFNASLKVNPDYLYTLMLFFAAELKESEQRMRNLAHMNTKGRIAYALFSLQQKFGVDADGFLNIVISRQDMAAYTGTTYETLFRMINELSTDEIIQVSEKRIRVMHLEKLKTLFKEQE